MPHLRKRHLLEVYQKLLTQARIVGVIGHRQTGKTTFIQKHSKSYCSFDDAKTLAHARKDANSFLDSFKGDQIAIDECQMVPQIFPALKLKVGTSQKPGRFILSGSIRFSSQKSPRESLAGRLSNIELFPLTLTEMLHEPLAAWLYKLSQNPMALKSYCKQVLDTQTFQERSHAISRYEDRGGLPGICFVRESQARNRLLGDLIRLILDRDIRLIHRTTASLPQIEELARALSQDPLNIVSFKEMAQRADLSLSTIQKLLSSMENVFLIRRIPLEGDYKGELFWFEDQLEEALFRGGNASNLSKTTLIYRNVREQFGYRFCDPTRYFQYRTRGGALMPLVINSGQSHIGLYPIDSADELNRSHLRQAASFLSRYQNSVVIFVTFRGRDAHVINDRTACVPAAQVLF